MRILWRAFKTLLIFVSGFVTGVFVFLRLIANSPIMLSKLKEGFVDGLEQLLFGRTRYESYTAPGHFSYASYCSPRYTGNTVNKLPKFLFASQVSALQFKEELQKEFDMFDNLSVGDVIRMYNDSPNRELAVPEDRLDDYFIWYNPDPDSILVKYMFDKFWEVRIMQDPRRNPAL